MTNSEFEKKLLEAHDRISLALAAIFTEISTNPRGYIRFSRQLACFEKIASELPSDTWYNSSFFGEFEEGFINAEVKGLKNDVVAKLRKMAGKVARAI